MTSGLRDGWFPPSNDLNIKFIKETTEKKKLDASKEEQG